MDAVKLRRTPWSTRPEYAAVFQRDRTGRQKEERPWISVGLCTGALDPMALLSTSTLADADDVLKLACAVMCLSAND